MPVWSPLRAIEIDKKLRDDFRHLLREYGITTRETDEDCRLPAAPRALYHPGTE
jgi:hypothetical protein